MAVHVKNVKTNRASENIDKLFSLNCTPPLEALLRPCSLNDWDTQKCQFEKNDRISGGK